MLRRHPPQLLVRISHVLPPAEAKVMELEDLMTRGPRQQDLAGVAARINSLALCGVRDGFLAGTAPNMFFRLHLLHSTSSFRNRFRLEFGRCSPCLRAVKPGVSCLARGRDRDVWESDLHHLFLSKGRNL